MIGRTISHYEVLAKLGEGGMGVVYNARDTQLNRQVALKALRADTAADPERRARFLQEAQAASALNHPEIVTIHDVLKDDEGPFHLALFSVETGERQRLTTPPANSLGDVGPALSPDGRTLTFTRQLTSRTSHLLLLPLDPGNRPTGDPRRIAAEVPHPNHPVFMPSGDEILFCSGIQHAAALWRVRTDGGSPAAPLGLGGRGAVWPDVDPTGTKLLYTKHVWDPNIWRVALESSGPAGGAPSPGWVYSSLGRATA
ncbi:MAG: protein kinase [Acidobacteria bacterium]|nr:protein kinase [Acidobacteriota bacterium]